MDIHTKLIELYCAVCHQYGTCLVAHAQRQSNNFCPQFKDEERIATFMWGIPNQKFEVKACYNFTCEYYGIKLHTLAQCNYKAMPTPALMTLSKASEHDLPIAIGLLDDVMRIRVFGNTAFADKDWQSSILSKNNVGIFTPIKRVKRQKKLSFWDAVYSSAISSVKQAIESFNNWIIIKTNIQRASKVRSSAGLTAFIFARIACACFWLNS